MRTETDKLKESDLDQFTGTEQYYKHWLGINYTDGVKYLAERAGAYWLIDLIASSHRKEPFQVSRLEKTDKGWLATMKEDSDQPVLVRQEIEYSDFPLNEIELWLIDGVLLLKSEY